MIHHVTGCEDPRNAGLCGITVNTGLNFDVAVFQFKLTVENGGIRAVTDSDKQSGNVK